MQYSGPFCTSAGEPFVAQKSLLLGSLYCSEIHVGHAATAAGFGRVGDYGLGGEEQSRD